MSKTNYMALFRIPHLKLLQALIAPHPLIHDQWIQVKNALQLIQIHLITILNQHRHDYIRTTTFSYLIVEVFLRN